jgi:hypothetical protein
MQLLGRSLFCLQAFEFPSLGYGCTLFLMGVYFVFYKSSKYSLIFIIKASI